MKYFDLSENHEPEHEENLVSRKWLAERWSCSIETLKRMEKRDQLHPVKLGRRMLRYRLSEIEKLESEAG